MKIKDGEQYKKLLNESYKEVIKEIKRSMEEFYKITSTTMKRVPYIEMSDEDIDASIHRVRLGVYMNLVSTLILDSKMTPPEAFGVLGVANHAINLDMMQK